MRCIKQSLRLSQQSPYVRQVYKRSHDRELFLHPWGDFF
jgi:hypothetical protein